MYVIGHTLVIKTHMLNILVSVFFPTAFKCPIRLDPWFRH